MNVSEYFHLTRQLIIDIAARREQNIHWTELKSSKKYTKHFLQEIHQSRSLLTKLPFLYIQLGSDLEIMISLFLIAGLKRRPECRKLVWLNYLHFRLDCQVYSTKHSVLIFLFSNKNTQHSHKDEKVGNPFSLLVFVISFYMEYIQKSVTL